MKNVEGDDFRFLIQDAYSKTAFVQVDYGDETLSYRVATNIHPAEEPGRYLGIPMRDVMRTIGTG